MPRTKVTPGNCSKRSSSSASTWRGASFRWWATSDIVSPSRSRAFLSSAPTGSVILPPLQRLVFGRPGETPAQLVGVALLGHALAQVPLDAQCQPERLRGRRDELVVTRDQLARLLVAALPVADLAELEQRRRLVGVELQRPLEVILCVLGIVDAQGANAGGGIRAPWHGVERILHRLHEVADALLLPPRLAQEPAVVVVDVGIVRRNAQRTLEAVLRLPVLAQLHVDQAVEPIRGCIRLV